MRVNLLLLQLFYSQISDVTKAVIQVLLTTDSLSKTYEIGGPTIYTMDALYDLIQQALKIDHLYTIELSNQTMMYFSHSFAHPH
jgi:hypothetical protein